MKRTSYILLCLLAFLLAASAALYARPLRLHILANSDSLADQAVKLKVRDAILRETGEEFSGVLTEQGAEAAVNRNLSRIEETADRVLRDNGFSYGVSSELGTFDFPEREYAERTYPAGKYRALRLKLGNGEGHNWWCVLFPPLCMVNTQPGDDVEYRSFLMDWLKGVWNAS